MLGMSPMPAGRRCRPSAPVDQRDVAGAGTAGRTVRSCPGLEAPAPGPPEPENRSGEHRHADDLAAGECCGACERDVVGRIAGLAAPRASSVQDAEPVCSAEVLSTNAAGADRRGDQHQQQPETGSSHSVHPQESVLRFQGTDASGGPGGLRRALRGCQRGRVSPATPGAGLCRGMNASYHSIQTSRTITARSVTRSIRMSSSLPLRREKRPLPRPAGVDRTQAATSNPGSAARFEYLCAR